MIRTGVEQHPSEYNLCGYNEIQNPPERYSILNRKTLCDDIKDMSYPGSSLHQLKGDKEGLFSVKVSGNWRVFFEFKNGDAYIVDYDDYH